jgi:predicted RNA-binding protein with RPS1 domain
MLTRKIKGGVTVDLMGVDAFLPGSQIALRRVPNIEDLIGQTFDFKIIKLNKRRRNIVVSRRVILEEEREGKREQLVKELLVGQVRKGVVKNVTDFGAFIDLGGLDGLLHITDMSWGRVGHPSEIVQIGDELDVKVLDIDWNRERISLGLKQLLPYPWKDIERKYPVGVRVRGKVVSITNYGAFVELEKGVEGLVHISEMSWTRNVKHPSKLVNIGDEIEAVVLKVDRDDEKISLGMKQIEEDPWLALPEKYPIGTRVEGKVRNLTSFGAFVEIEPGIDGLIHISDMSWTKRVQHPSEVLRKGDDVSVRGAGRRSGEQADLAGPEADAGRSVGRLASAVRCGRREGRHGGAPARGRRGGRSRRRRRGLHSAQPAGGPPAKDAGRTTCARAACDRADASEPRVIEFDGGRTEVPAIVLTRDAVLGRWSTTGPASGDVTTLAACAARGPEPDRPDRRPETPAPRPEEERVVPLRIGAILPESGAGTLREYALLVRQGIDIALGEETRDIELVVLDDAGDPARAAALTRDLAERGALGIIGPLLGESVDAAAAGRSDPSLALLSPTSSDPPVGTNTYTLNAGDDRGAEALARFATQRPRPGRAAVLESPEFREQAAHSARARGRGWPSGGVTFPGSREPRRSRGRSRGCAPPARGRLRAGR